MFSPSIHLPSCPPSHSPLLPTLSQRAGASSSVFDFVVGSAVGPAGFTRSLSFVNPKKPPSTCDALCVQRQQFAVFEVRRAVRVRLGDREFCVAVCVGMRACGRVCVRVCVCVLACVQVCEWSAGGDGYVCVWLVFCSNSCFTLLLPAGRTAAATVARARQSPSRVRAGALCASLVPLRRWMTLIQSCVPS